MASRPAGTRHAQPQNEALEAGGREKKAGREKEKVWPNGAPLGPGRWGRGLGGEGVVVTLATFALAAQDEGCGQEEEGRGHQ